MRFWKMGLPACVTYIVIGLVFKVIFNEPITTSVVSKTIIHGFLFGMIMTWLWHNSSARQLKKTQIDLLPEEILIKEGSATHQLQYGATAGKLALTNQRLIFKSHRSNGKSQEVEIPLDSIESLSTGKSLVFFHNVLHVSFSGKKESFILLELQKWADAIAAKSPQAAV